MRLVAPAAVRTAALERFRQSYFAAGEGVETLGALAVHARISDWLKEAEQLSHIHTTPDGRIPRKQWLYMREDGEILGLLQIRFMLIAWYRQYAGHIGYTIRPDERRKGYASQLLREAIPLCHDLGISPILVCCERENEASIRTILKNGGRYESTAVEPQTKAHICRYWI